MFWSKKKQAPSRRKDFASGESMQSYSYHNVRSDKDLGQGRDIKKSGAQRLKSAKNLWVEKFGLIVLAIVVVICLFNVLYLSSNSVVIVDGTSSNPAFKQYQSAVEKTANKLFASSILNSNKITVDTNKIESTLESDYPMYSSISVSLPLIDRHPVIYITPALPALVLSNTSGQYLINEDGQIMLRSPSSTGFNKLELPIVSYQVNGYLSSGQKILTNAEVQFIQVVIYELGLRGNKVSSISLPQGTSELNVYLSGLPYYVKFNLENNSPRQQTGSFLATQQYLKSQNITPSQYVDVRTPGRVFYL